MKTANYLKDSNNEEKEPGNDFNYDHVVKSARGLPILAGKIKKNPDGRVFYLV